MHLPFLNRSNIKSPFCSLLSTPGLVACYLPYLDGSGQSLTDWSGQGNHAQLGSTAGADTNDPSWGTNALTFGGDDYCVMPTIAISRGIGICIALNLYGIEDTQYFMGGAAGTINGIRYNGSTLAWYSSVLCEWNYTPAAGGDLLFFHWPSVGNPVLYVNGISQGIGTSDISVGYNLSIIGARSGGSSLQYTGSIYFCGIWSSISTAEIIKTSANIKTLLAGQGVTLA